MQNTNNDAADRRRRITAAVQRRFELDQAVVDYWHGLTADEQHNAFETAAAETRSAVYAETKRAALGQRGFSGRGSSLATAAYNAHSHHVRMTYLETIERPIRRMARRVEIELWKQHDIAIVNDQLHGRDDLPAAIVTMLDGRS